MDYKRIIKATENLKSPVESVGAKKDGGQVGPLLPAQLQLARGGKGGGEVLEGALQPREEEVEHGHQGDQEEPVPGPQGGLGVGLLLHNVQLPALLHLQAALLHLLSGVDDIVGKVTQGVDSKAQAKETIERVYCPQCVLIIFVKFQIMIRVEVMMVSVFTLPWLPRKGLAKTGVRKEPRPKKRCIVYLRAG